MLTAVSLALATLVSEDLASVTAGLLVRQGEISASAAIAACIVGIAAGDCGLWAVGRFGGSAVLTWPWLSRRFDGGTLGAVRDALHRYAGLALVTSRFTPGTRLPLYVIAGLVRLPFPRFAAWTLVGALTWTPLIVLMSATTGSVVVFDGVGGHALSLMLAIGAVLAVRFVIGRAHWGTGDGR